MATRFLGGLLGMAVALGVATSVMAGPTPGGSPTPTPSATPTAEPTPTPTPTVVPTATPTPTATPGTPTPSSTPTATMVPTPSPTPPLSDCCFDNGTPGCDDPTCEATVCAADSFCCDTVWDSLCADAAVALCGSLCPQPTPSATPTPASPTPSATPSTTPSATPTPTPTMGLGEFAADLDATFWRDDNSKIYWFKGTQYIRFTTVPGADAGYPLPIAGNWPGLPGIPPGIDAVPNSIPPSFLFDLDAALMRFDNGKIYFFKDDYYVRYTKVSDGIDPGYPRRIAGNWPGLPPEFLAGIDAALFRNDNGKIYLFKDGMYVRYTKISDGVDPGYPKPIAGNWPGLPANFATGLDAAMWRDSNNKIYFFKGNEYVRYTKVSDGVDPGYPKPIAPNWLGPLP